MPIKIKDFHAEHAGPPATPRIGLLRLERLASILEEAHKRYKSIGAILEPEYDEYDEYNNVKEIEGYDQVLVGHSCGTPACAIGHYAFNTPQRWGWSARGDVRVAEDFVDTYGEKYGQYGDLEGIDWAEQAAHEFCLSLNNDSGDFEESEVGLIFGGFGCGRATTAKEAAAYIRKFVAKKRKELGLKKPVKK